MADEEPKPVKKEKKRTVPEKRPEPRGPLPSASDVRAAKKAELVAWSDQYELSTHRAEPAGEPCAVRGLGGAGQ